MSDNQTKIASPPGVMLGKAVDIAFVLAVLLWAYASFANGHSDGKQTAALERIAAALEAVPPVCEITGLAGPMAETLEKAATPRGK